VVTLTRMQARGVARAFTEWQRSVAELARILTVAERVVRRMQHNSCLHTLAQWKSHLEDTVHMRQLMERLVPRMRYGATGKAMARWIEYLGEIARTRRTIQKLLEGRVSRAFQSWVYVVDDLNHQHTVVSKIMHRLQNNRAAMAFDGWAQGVETAVRRAVVLDRIVRRMKFGAQTSAFLAWVDFCARSVLMRRAVTKVKWFKFQHILRAWFRTTKRSQLERADEDFNGAQDEIESLTQRLQKATEESEQLNRDEVEGLTQRLQQLAEQTASAKEAAQDVQGLCQVSADEVLREQMLTREKLALQKTLLGSNFGKHLLRRHRREALAVVVKAWWNHASGEGKVRDIVARATSKNRLQVVQGAIQRWRQLCLTRCFLNWRRVWQAAASLRQRGRILLRRWGLGSATRCFAMWARACAAKASLGRRTRQAAGRLRKRAVAAALVSWVAMVADAHRRVELGLKVVMRMSMMAAARAMTRWKQHRRQRMLGRRAVAVLSKRLLFLVLRRWQRWASIVARSQLKLDSKQTQLSELETVYRLFEQKQINFSEHLVRAVQPCDIPWSRSV
jgi:hypothetical protein